MLVTDDVDVAVDELTGFYANYHSMRFVEGNLVLRVQPRARRRAARGAERGVRATSWSKGRIERIGATKIEIRDKDFPELDRVTFRFDRRSWARLRELIDALNRPYRT